MLGPQFDRDHQHGKDDGNRLRMSHGRSFHGREHPVTNPMLDPGVESKVKGSTGPARTAPHNSTRCRQSFARPVTRRVVSCASGRS